MDVVSGEVACVTVYTVAEIIKAVAVISSMKLYPALESLRLDYLTLQTTFGL